MKKILLLCTLLLLVGCKKATVNVELNQIDAMTGASSTFEYEQSSYDLKTLKEKLKLNEFGNIVPSSSISTVNEDLTPNVAIFIPTIVTIDHKDYITAWFSSDSNTFVNLKAGRKGVFLFNDYDNTLNTPKSATNKEKTETKLARNQGCRVIIKYVGDQKQNDLYKKASLPDILKTNKLLLEIIKIYPLG